MTFRPHSISWNLTYRCNLRCAHCYLDAIPTHQGACEEMGTAPSLDVVDQVAAVNQGAILILTGGEPLLRDDIFAIISRASARGLIPVLGTNGTLVDGETAESLLKAGLRGAGVSIDSLSPSLHDRFRGAEGALDAALNGMRELRKAGVDLLVHTTATSWNLGEIPRIIDFAEREGVAGINIFFLVCTGRGEGLTDISPSQYEETLSLILEKQKGNGFLIRAKCAPQYNRLVHGDGTPLLSAMSYPGGCPAGVHYCRITPEGLVTPCPYISAPAGDLRRENFEQIWNRSPLLQQLRNPERKGKCGRCEYSSLCGGCRARALASSGDMMGEDPWCAHEPEDKGEHRADRTGESAYGTKVAPTLPWSDEALEMLGRAPSFARGMITKGVERYAREKGLTAVDADLMREARGHLLKRGRRILHQSQREYPPKDKQ